MSFSPLRLPAVITLAVALAASGLASCGGSADATPEEYIARAKDFQDRHELQAAVIELKNALLQEPNNIEARGLLGTIYVTVGNGAAAEKELRQAIELGLMPEAAAIPLTRALLLQAKYKPVIDDPVKPESLPGDDQAELWALRGNAYFGLGELDAAEKFYDTALSLSADNAEAGTGKVRVEVVRNQLDEARKRLAEVIETHPDFAPAWSLLGNIERFNNEAKEAEKAYSKAIDLRYDNAVDLFNRTLVRIYLEDFEGAADDIQRLKKRAPGHLLVTYAQGVLHFSQSRYDEAKTAFQETVNRNRSYMPAVYYLGLVYYMQGHSEQAEHHLRRFLNKYQTSASTAKLLAAMYVQQGRYDDAESMLKLVLTRNTDDVFTLDLMADVAMRRGNAHQGIEHLQRVVAQQPESTDAYMRLGIGLMIAEEDGEALQAFGKATELSPSSQDAELHAILALLQAGEYDKALEAAKRLSEKQPENPDAFTLMGGAYIGKGDEASARAAFQQALKVAPGWISAAHNLAKLEIRAGNKQEARRLYEEVLQHSPAHLATLLSLVELDTSEEKTADAIRHLEYAVKEHPEALPPKVQLAGYYLQTGEPERVLPLLQDLPAEQANSPFVLGAVGEAQLALGQTQNALRSLERLVQAVPDSARAHYLLAKGYTAANQPNKALAELEKVLAIRPDHLQSKVVKVRILRQQNKTDEAAKLLGELSSAYPNQPDVLTEAGWHALKQGRPGEAVQAFEAALSQAKHSDMIIALGTAKWQAGDKEGAIETFSGWLTEHPNDTQVQLQLANSRLLLGQSREAKAGFERIVVQSPDNAIALNNLAWLLRDSEPDKALRYAEHAVEVAPQWAPALNTLGLLLLNQGKTERALHLLQEASELEPENLNMRYHVAQASARLGDEAKARHILEAILSEQKPFERKQDAESLLRSLTE